MEKVSVFTCSYNKAEYIGEAISSVLSQSYRDFEYWILENSTDEKTRTICQEFSKKDKRINYVKIDFTEEFRKEKYVESYLKNFYFPLTKGKYLMTLSDDDILSSNCFEVHLLDFKKFPGHKINYHWVKTVHLNSEQESFLKQTRIFDASNAPSCQIDGGSIMFRKVLLKKLKQPYFLLEWATADISDGIFMNKLAEVEKFYPIEEVLSVKRRTPISTFQKA